MGTLTLDLQQKINATSAIAPIPADGRFGPLTRAAIIEVFRNTRAPAVTPEDIASIAGSLGVPTRNLKAVAQVESGGGGWDRSGLLACLWERHYLWRRVRIAVPFLSNPTPGGYTIDADRDGINDSWEKLADSAGRFGFPIAAECASFGKFQIMGAHWKALGYASVWDFIWQLSRGEAAHYRAFAAFVRVNGLIPALQAVNGNPAACTAFARGYNGKGQKGYDSRIAAAWRALA
jgi:hypothetical protein